MKRADLAAVWDYALCVGVVRTTRSAARRLLLWLLGVIARRRRALSLARRRARGTYRSTATGHLRHRWVVAGWRRARVRTLQEINIGFFK